MRKRPHPLMSLAIGSTYTLGCSLLPGGLGEFVLPIVFRKTGEVAQASVSIMIARIQDLASWIAIILVGSLFVHLHAFAGNEMWLMGLSICLIAALCALMVLPRLRLGIIRLCLRLPLVGRYESFLLRVHGGLSEQWHNLPAWLVTLGLRIVMIGAYVSLLDAIGAQVPIVATAVAGGLVALLLVIPVQGVGGLGTTELWWLVAMDALGLGGASGGLVGAVMLHVPTLIYSVLVGVVGMYLFRARLGRSAS